MRYLTTGSRATLPSAITLPDLKAALDKPAGVLDAGHAGVRIGHNTYAFATATGSRLWIDVVLHDTAIATFHRVEGVEDLPELWVLTIATGGWDTVTTRDRINRVLRPLGLNLYSNRGERRIAGVVVDGHLQDRAAYLHLGTGLPVTTVLEDGTRVVPPYLPEAELDTLLAQGISVACFTAAAPDPGEVVEAADLI